MNNIYQEKSIKQKLNERDLDYSDNHNFTKTGKYIKPTKFTIHTQEDRSVGMYGWSKGKSGKEHIYTEKKFDKIMKDEKELDKIQKDLYDED